MPPVRFEIFVNPACFRASAAFWETGKNRGLREGAKLILVYYVPSKCSYAGIPPWTPKKKQSTLAPGFSRSPSSAAIFFVLTQLFPFHAASGSSRLPRFGPLASQFGQTPKNPPRLLRMSPFACLQNGQRRGFEIPRQFLYSRYSYPVGAMPDPRSFGNDFKKAVMRLGFAGLALPRSQS